VEQAKKRLLSAFAKIYEEAEQAEKAHWDESGLSFNPDTHDEGSLAEAARDHGVVFYQMLSEMHERTRLSIVAGMYHHWDKSWRRFLVEQLRWPGLVPGPRTRRLLWRLESVKLETLLHAFGLDVRSFPDFLRLDAMRLVVKVFKHGEGASFDDLQKLYPSFVPPPLVGWVSTHPDDTNMRVTDTQLDEFARAIESFWRSVPYELTFDANAELQLPKEFERALRDDMA